MMDGANILITGGSGQVGTALRQKYPAARAPRSHELDVTDREAVMAYDWHGVEIIINAAAYTDVDGAETPAGRVAAWQTNATGVRNLAEAALTHDMRLVHISSDYVFDGSQTNHAEDEPFSPLNVYGQSKAAGDFAASLVAQHYIVRTSWVIGDGKNFVRTMLELGRKGIAPKVVNDQIGRLTFTDTLAAAIDHLLANCPFGTYNVTNEGEPVSWADITAEIFRLSGYDQPVTGIPATAYFADNPTAAPRPLHSTLDLTKLQTTGFKNQDWRSALQSYIHEEA